MTESALRHSFEKSLLTKKSILECSDSVRGVLKFIGCKNITCKPIDNLSGAVYEGKIGCSLAKIDQGIMMLIPQKYYPMVLAIEILEAKNEVEVKLKINETEGKPLIFNSLKDRFKLRIEDLGSQIVNMLKIQLQ